jgi:hypothetical protein
MLEHHNVNVYRETGGKTMHIIMMALRRDKKYFHAHNFMLRETVPRDIGQVGGWLKEQSEHGNKGKSPAVP